MKKKSTTFKYVPVFNVELSLDAGQLYRLVAGRSKCSLANCQDFEICSDIS